MLNYEQKLVLCNDWVVSLGNMSRLDSRVLYALCGSVAGAVIVGSISLIFFYHIQPTTLRPLRESDIPSSGGYMFTDPLIGVSANGNPTSSIYSSLEQRVQSFIDSQKMSGLFSASVKFSDILQSDGFTINEDETYDPASLTKVPLAIAYYNLAAQDQSILSDQVIYTGTPDLDANEQIRSAVQLYPGQSYTVEILIEHMIKYSDNNAEQLLADHLAARNKLDILTSLFANLGVKIDPTHPDDMTVQSYSLFLRTLFNATYLDRNYSEKLLQLLSESDFSQGIDAGVPNNVLVAEKFGDAKIPDAKGNVIGAELHNCGIVYYPKHPFLLCIMTKGSNLTTLEHVIAGISHLIYQGVQGQYQVI